MIAELFLNPKGVATVSPRPAEPTRWSQRTEPHGLCLHYVPTKVLNKYFFSAAKPPEQSQRSGVAQVWRHTVLFVLFVLYVLYVVFVVSVLFTACRDACATPLPRLRPALGVGGPTHQPASKAGRR